MAKLRDFVIIMWVLMQGLSWMFPQAYGHFNAVGDVSYQDTMEKLGIWEE